MKVINIGRAPDNDIVFDDKTVSRRHAYLFKQGGQWFIADRGSTHGTYVNNSTVEGKIKLQSGDKIKINDIKLVFTGNCLRYLDGEILIDLTRYETTGRTSWLKSRQFITIAIGIFTLVAVLALALDNYVDYQHSKYSQSHSVEETIYNGTFSFPDGEYSGELKDGLPHGYGIFLYNMPKRSLAFSDIITPQRRQKYSGQWHNGLKHGEGVMTFPDGSSVSGFWKNNNYIGTTEQ